MSLAVLGAVPMGILILYLPSCSGSTRRFFGTGMTSFSFVVEVAGAATLRRGIGGAGIMAGVEVATSSSSKTHTNMRKPKIQ